MDPTGGAISGAAGVAAVGSAIKNAGGEVGEQLVSGAARPFQIFWEKVMGLWDKISEKFGWIAVVVLIAWLVVRFGPGLWAGAARGLNEQGVSSGEDAVRRVGEEAENIGQGMSGEFEKQQAAVSGDYYESEIDEYSKEDLGVEIEELTLSESSYKVSDPVSAWIHIKANTIPNDESEMIVNVQCILKDPKNEDDLIYGRTSNDVYEYSVVDEEEFDINCNFDDGDLVEGTNEVIARVTYDFYTSSFLEASFMDYQSLRTVLKDNPDLLADVEQDPTATNTQGPVAVGIGTRSFPIPVGSTKDPTLGISLTNRWDGEIKNFSNILIVVPDSIELPNCDSTKPIKKISDPDLEMEGYNVYAVDRTGIDNINQNLARDENNFVSEDITCIMNIDKSSMLSGASLLSPVYKTIFVNAQYTYQAEIKEYVRVEDDEGFIVRWMSDGDLYGEVHEDSDIACVGDYYDGQIASAKFDVELFRNDVSLAKIEDLSATVQPQSKRASSPILLLNQESMFGQRPERGDSILCTMRIMPKYGSEIVVGARYATVVNAKPQLDEIKIYPETLTTLDDVRCEAIFTDADADPITASYSIKLAGKEQRNGQASCEAMEPNKYKCQALLNDPVMENNNLVYCEMIPHDGFAPGNKATITNRAVTPPEGHVGIDYVSESNNEITNDYEPDLNRDKDTSDSELKEPIDNPETSTSNCEDTDGGIATSSYGTATGINENNLPVSLSDRCTEDGKLIEYFCDGPYVRYNEYNCEYCQNGICG
jgi:hypothetical protein